MQELVLRPTSRADLPEVGRIIAAGTGGTPERWASVVEGWVEEDAPTRRIWVAERDGAILGHTTLSWMRCGSPDDPRCAPEGWYCSGLDVRPDVRRTGVGRALTQARLDWLRTKEVREVRYVRFFDNPAIGALMERFGFSLEAPDVWLTTYPEPPRRMELFRLAL